MLLSKARKLTLKKVCSNCVMVAGAVTALTGAAKSVVELFPTGCAMKAEAPAPPVVVEAPKSIRRGPASVESRPEPPPVVYHMEAPKKFVWIWPVIAVIGVLVVALGRRLKRTVKDVAKI